MTVVPVIMCGGAGTRLWPASTSDRPKQFASLVGPRSSFLDAVARAMAIGSDDATMIVTGLAHRGLVTEQLRAAGVDAEVLLEPTPRDSAAAMAAAAVHAARLGDDTVLVVLSADHNIPDLAAFQATVAKAIEGARSGFIVTLGVSPSEPCTAYGYIRSDLTQGDPRPVLSFVEKPALDLARRYVEDGYLWNSGIFVVTASTLMAELERYAPDVLRHARAAVVDGRRDGRHLFLDDSFNQAPKISIDFAVMEKTALAAVVTAGFDWADLGAWDSIWSASTQDVDGNSASDGAILVGSRNVLARASGGVRLAVVGLSNVAVVADQGSVLVCALDQAQAVKQVVDRIRREPQPPFATLAEARDWLDLWMTASALPLWWALGADHAGGGFQETLSAITALPSSQRRRARVQARQTYVYARAGEAGWAGPWREAAWHGMNYLTSLYRRTDGLYRAWVDPSGGSASDEAWIYDQAFVLLAMSALHRADPGPGAALAEAAEALWGALSVRAMSSGGYRETGPRPYQSNCHMHLFESALAWSELASEAWGPRADALGTLALAHFIDPDLGVVREVFDETWAPAADAEGRLIEPGHQFEWAWLMARWQALRPAAAARATVGDIARRLYAAGLKGVDPGLGVAVNELRDDFTPVDPGARLWPQTERLRTALSQGDEAEALAAVNGLKRYLDTPARGTWRDMMRPDGTFVDESAPGSSLYHILGAWLAARTFTATSEL